MEGDPHALEVPGVVLAVDDLQDNLDLVEEILGSAGFVMRLAHSSELPNGDYEVGGAFARPLSREELAALSEGGQV